MLAYPYTPERQLETPSGWCITGHHDGCRYQFNHGKCGCACHTQTAPVKRGRPKKVEGTKPDIIIVDQANPDPRPWKRNNE